MHGMRAFKKREEKKKRKDKIHPVMIVLAVLLFNQTIGAVFSPKDIYLVCQQNLIIAEGGFSTHNRFPQNIPHSVRFS